MLQLKNVTKNYYVGDMVVEALKGVNLSFRKNEFVSILGPSGCGKTTLLNIIGGLDRYTSGDIIINDVSTKLYNDGDWDTYRNHSIGFVFQSYNLIPHQTVLANVELALTLSGIDPKTRKERAKRALEKVGLADQIKKLPAQLSGGQMQRVAIARALVNDPDIILADEPTGALDTETSIQVMNILKELANDKLVIMVTHNPELASAYSTRIINLRDGLVKEDSNPYEHLQTSKNSERTEKQKKAKKPSMSFLTALSLSLNNLSTKKARTVLTSFAGSIGIIGIALILSLSSGFSNYIDKVQRDTLSNYPITIQGSSVDLSDFATSFLESSANTSGLTPYPDSEEVLTSPIIGNAINTIPKMTFGKNDLSAFKQYVQNNPKLFNEEKISSVSYSYSFSFNLYQKENSAYKRVNYIGPKENYFPENMDSTLNAVFNMAYDPFKEMMNSGEVWGELIGNNNLLKAQYDILAGDWPTQDAVAENEPYPLVVVVDQYNRLPDYALYMMGLLSDEEVKYIMTKMAVTFKVTNDKANKNLSQEQIDSLVQAELDEIFPDFESNYTNPIPFSSIINKEYNVLLESEYYKKTATTTNNGKDYNTYSPVSAENSYVYNDTEDNKFLYSKLENSAKVKIVAILRAKEGTAASAFGSNIYYTPAFEEYLVDRIQTVDVIKDQLQYFNDEDYYTVDGSSKTVYSTLQLIDASTYQPLPRWLDTELHSDYIEYLEKILQITNKNNPSSISIYPTSFENKDYVLELIDEYNAKQIDEESQIKYSDFLGMMMSSITDIIDAITYVLIAFVSISLVVSSIMIGVITYISVLERTKEIGVLRAMGASKRDIARVFNAETVIIGFISGLLGITITILLNIPISLIIEALAGIAGVSALPVAGAVTLVLISVALTLIAGIIPSGMASKKDPVIALRSE